jgi:hypothetical protein
MTDGQPASPSWNKAPIWGLRPDLYYSLTVAGLLIWGALSDERTCLSFIIAVELVAIFYCLRFETFLFVAYYDSQSHDGGIRSRLQTGSNQFKSKSKLCQIEVKVTLRLTVSQSVNLGVKPHLGHMTRYLLLCDSYGSVLGGRPL